VQESFVPTLLISTSLGYTKIIMYPTHSLHQVDGVQFQPFISKEKSVTMKKGSACTLEYETIHPKIALKNIIALRKHQARVWGAG